MRVFAVQMLGDARIVLMNAEGCVYFSQKCWRMRVFSLKILEDVRIFPKMLGNARIFPKNARGCAYFP